MIYLAIVLPFTYLTLAVFALMSLQYLLGWGSRFPLSGLVASLGLLLIFGRLSLIGGEVYEYFLPRFTLIGIVFVLVATSRKKIVLNKQLLNISLLFCFFSQALMSLSPDSVSLLYEQVRIGEFEVDTYGERLGGWIANPNQHARAVSLLLCLRWIVFRDSGGVVTVLGLVSIVLSGSRTGLISVALVYFLLFFRPSRTGNILLLLGLLLAGVFGSDFGAIARLLLALEDGSLISKLGPILYVFSTDAVWFGVSSSYEYGAIVAQLRQEWIDSDFGNFVALFGLSGIALVAVVGIPFFLTASQGQKILIIWFGCWVLTSSVLLNYWFVFPFLCLVSGTQLAETQTSFSVSQKEAYK